MKKLICILAVLCCAVSLSAIDLIDISGDVGIGYMNYSIITTYRTKFSAELSQALQNSLDGLGGHLDIDDPKSTDVYNALALGFSIKISYYYMNLNIGLPFKQVPSNYDPLAKILKEHKITDKLNSSVIADLQLGGGITLLKSTPLNIFVGGGIGINYIRTKRNMPKSFVETIKTVNAAVDADKVMMEVRDVALAGIGADVGIKYFFTKNIGVCFDIKESLYFIPLVNRRYYRGTTTEGSGFTYYVTKEKTANTSQKESIKSLIKYQWANNFTARLGIAFKL